MNSYIPVFLVVLQITSYACASSFGRYSLGNLRSQKNERHKRMHEFDAERDCLYGLCQHVTNYPEARVSNLIKKHASLHSYFGGTVIEPADIQVGTRNNEERNTFCRTTNITVVPKESEDIQGVKRIIANTEDFGQVVKYELCANDEKESCLPGNTLGYKTRCLQKFNDIKLLTYNEDTDELQYRKFHIPSTCVCTYIKVNF